MVSLVHLFSPVQEAGHRDRKRSRMAATAATSTSSGSVPGRKQCKPQTRIAFEVRQLCARVQRLPPRQRGAVRPAAEAPLDKLEWVLRLMRNTAGPDGSTAPSADAAQPGSGTSGSRDASTASDISGSESEGESESEHGGSDSESEGSSSSSSGGSDSEESSSGGEGESSIGSDDETEFWGSEDEEDAVFEDETAQEPTRQVCWEGIRLTAAKWLFSTIRMHTCLRRS